MRHRNCVLPAIKIPLLLLTPGKAQVRSALNRASRKRAQRVATASDDRFLYVWKEPSSGA